MGHPLADEERERLIDGLMRRAHEQSRCSPERSPFWREGKLRCEFHRQPGDERLKIFSGERCIHEEAVQSRSAADARARELREELRTRTRLLSEG